MENRKQTCLRLHGTDPLFLFYSRLVGHILEVLELYREFSITIQKAAFAHSIRMCNG